MIIKNIEIENYLCYYGINKFDLSEGLNIILGENGEGKTKFFEAVEWLMNGENQNLESLVSAKRLAETETEENFRVMVSMTVEQYGETSIIRKSFIGKKTKDNECTTSNFMVEGIDENSLGERTQVNGKDLLDRIFPFQIRKYSMFKGEDELNIFKNDNALENLINLFSEAKHYGKYTDKGSLLREKAEKAVEDSSKLDRKNATLYKRLEAEIRSLEREENKFKVHLSATESEMKKIEVNLQDAERHVNNADTLDTLKKRIKEIEDKIDHFTGKIDENYTISLFDENWILVNFESIQKDFSSKISDYSKKRRELQSEFDKERGFKEGEMKAKAELLNNAIPLPTSVPSKAIMEEMLEDEICKVCNRPAEKDSEPYEFMMRRLKAYLDSQSVKNEVTENNQQLFKFDYTNRLENLSLKHEDNLKKLRQIRNEIKDLFEFNDARTKDIEDLNKKLEKEKLEQEEILGNSSLGADRLSDVLKNYNAWQRDLNNQSQDHLNYMNKLSQIESQLRVKKTEKDNIDTKSASHFLIQTRNILRDIESIFNDTKEKKFDEFVEKLQDKSNSFFKTINIDAFTGTIVFKREDRGNRKEVQVELQEDSRTFHKPNQSLLTSMHISILFAISELASEIKEENFPMIFDAPTSSFGETKTTQFLNLVFETENQKILLIKDFIYTNEESETLSIKKEFENVRRDKAFWVKLERPFDPNNLKTINSKVITL